MKIPQYFCMITYQAIEYMLCGGVASYRISIGSITFDGIAFGGLDLIDLRRARPEHQVPVNLSIDEGTGTNPGLALTHNAFWVEPCANDSMRAYFMTESGNQADLLVYDATPWMVGGNQLCKMGHTRSPLALR